MTAEQDARALHLAGVAVEQIENLTGLNRRQVKAVIKATGGDEGPDLELSRLNTIWRKLYSDAVAGDRDAQKVALAVSERRLELQATLYRNVGRQSLREKTEESLQHAIDAGEIDPARSAGPIAALRLIAAQLDTPTFPIIDGRLDNVSPAKYLDYCRTLRLVPPDQPARPKPEKPRKAGGKLVALTDAAARRRTGA